MHRFAQFSFYLIALVLLSSNLLSAQGEYLRRGQSGLGIGFAVARNNGSFGLGGSLGYSVRGIFDAGFSLEQVSLSQQTNNKDISAVVVSPSIAFHARKDSGGYPIGTVHASYQYQSYSGAPVTGNFFAFGATIRATFPISSKALVQPAVDVSVLTGTTTYNNSALYPQETTDTKPIGIVSISFIEHSSEANLVVVSPAIAFDKDNTTIGASLSLVFVAPQKH